MGEETDEHENAVMSSAISRHKADNLDELSNENEYLLRRTRELNHRERQERGWGGGEELRRHNATTAIKGLTQQRDFSSRLKGVM